ncbi:DUF6087 family protein [Streptomyces sp. NPDC059278]|uniref:DUF6087 family protein n=1 Tax=Streptomyces sp. NPDC059278 TaxID=3346801 RepID=UPI0036CB98CB
MPLLCAGSTGSPDPLPSGHGRRVALPVGRAPEREDRAAPRCTPRDRRRPRASHPNPDAPRAIQRWNGHLWEPHGSAANLAEARRTLAGVLAGSRPLKRLPPGRPPTAHLRPSATT